MPLFWTIFNENQRNYKLLAYEVQTRQKWRKNTVQMYNQRLKKVLVEV